MEKKKSTNLKRQAWTSLLVLMLIIILLNFISSLAFFRIDFTKEKRFTLSDASKSYMKNLEDVVYVQVYLEGDFPAGFKRLRNATKETLDDLKAYAGSNLEYEFINPTEETDPKVREEVIQQLSKKGLTPINVQVRDDNGQRQQIVIPGAIVTYRGREQAFQLLQSSSVANSADEILNNSVVNLEFQLVNNIKKVTQAERPSIAFIFGHGELDTFRTGDIIKTLRTYYDVNFVNLLQTSPDDLLRYKALIIAKPTKVFREAEKFNLDQYVMSGGRILWMIDQLNADMDSLGASQMMLTSTYLLNLEDQLFRYGVRINTDLMQDIQCAPIPVITGNVGAQPQQELFPWLFYPIFIPNTTHPVAKSLDGIRSEFVSSIDTIDVPRVIKTPLLQSSNYTKILNAPVRVALQMLSIEPNPQQFIKKNLTSAIALEGTFTSVFKNRLIAKNDKAKYLEESKRTKMIVVSDGDIIKNYFSVRDSSVYPLGYDRFTRRTFSNSIFVQNAIDWLADDFNLISARSKEIKLRMLDSERIKKEKLRWQAFNIAMPSVLVILIGSILFYRRKKKYA
jgi:ABC-2 type transport system permease protein